MFFLFSFKKCILLIMLLQLSHSPPPYYYSFRMFIFKLQGLSWERLEGKGWEPWWGWFPGSLQLCVSLTWYRDCSCSILRVYINMPSFEYFKYVYSEYILITLHYVIITLYCIIHLNRFYSLHFIGWVLNGKTKSASKEVTLVFLLF